MQDTPQNDITSTLVQDLLKEKRADRRWKNIRSIAWLLFFGYAFFTIVSFVSKSGNVPTSGGNGKHVALIRLDGMIAPGRDFSAEHLTPVLHDAFADKNAAGVLIDINSPGGTPVQAAIIHDTIQLYKKRYKKKVIIVGEDLLTSGAYYVAVAGDKIYVNPNTLTGSIGVIMKGFGFVDAMKKLGIERRVYTAGTDKDRLDPFLPQSEADLKKIQEVMSTVHDNFAQAVMNGRKGKLKADPAILFSGDFWPGDMALKMGLVDGLGNLLDVSQNEFGMTKFKEYGGSSSLFKMLSGQLGSAMDSVFFTFS